MGEAKRRKQALGDRYGKTPSVLIPGSKQLKEQTDQFSNAYFAQFSTLKSSESQEQSMPLTEVLKAPESVEQDSALIAMQEWVKGYLEPYRPKDREQLVMGLLEPFYFMLFQAPAEFFEKESMDQKKEHVGALMAGLTSLNILHSHLSTDKFEACRQPMRQLYWDMLDTVEEDAIDDEDNRSEAERLTKLFEVCLDEDDIPEFLRS